MEHTRFRNGAGRQLLLSVVADDALLDGHRFRALHIFAIPETLWPLTPFREPGAVEPIDQEEQSILIDAFTPLLKNKNPRLRAAAARAILEASWPKAASVESLRTQRALAALTSAYQSEPPGWPRDALAEAVAVIGGARHWQALTGNAHGVIAFLDARCGGDTGIWCLVVAPQADARIEEKPTLVLERISDKQEVVEKKELPTNPEGNWGYPSQRGLDAYCARISFSVADQTPGLWRMTVKGVAGDDKAPWTSEPCLFRLNPPPQPGQPPSLSPRITFDP